ncbi:MAG TPA: hypothetical protein PLC98_00415, partial [Anaerolineales bacterium]|nr:hypothetical protein [Anaerolineales bacterium]
MDRTHRQRADVAGLRLGRSLLLLGLTLSLTGCAELTSALARLQSAVAPAPAPTPVVVTQTP